MAQSRILREMYETAIDLHGAGAMSDETMREFNAMMLPEVKEFTSNQIVKIRKKNKASQAVFAAYLNVSASTVQKWEQGQKKPSRPALKLLNMIDRNGLSSLAA